MQRSRRLALIAAVTVLGLSACGDASKSTTATKVPAVIHIGTGNSSGGGRTEAAADRMMMPFVDITYVFDGVAPDLGATGPSWSFPAGANPDAARVAAMAAVLGIEGDVREVPADQGGGWMVGPADYSGATLSVTADGMASWWFNPAPQAVTTGWACPEKPVADPAAGAPDTMPPCETPPPPVGVPDQDAALEKAKTLITSLGYDPASFEYDTYADEWSANVTAYMLLGGRRSSVTMSVGFGAEGSLSWASGVLATPVPGADYPLIGIDAAVQRLNDDTQMWMTLGGMARGAAMETVGGAADTGDAATSIGGGTTAVAPVCDPAADCVIEPIDPIAAEPVTVHLTGARLDVTMVWDVDGTVWLLPAYTFTATDGGQYTVVAVDDSFLDLPEPLPMPEPLPVDTVVVDTVVVDTVVVDPVPVDTAATEPAPDTTLAADVAANLVGLNEDEAAKVAEENGWEIRVAERDGQRFDLTADFRPNRVNVAVTAGVITAVQFIG